MRAPRAPKLAPHRFLHATLSNDQFSFDPLKSGTGILGIAIFIGNIAKEFRNIPIQQNHCRPLKLPF